MALEDRVKALEQEMKVLKNEIQSTLLDIQEQVLIHRYPSLRAEESLPPEGVMRSLESTSEERKGKPKEALTSPEGQLSSRSKKGVPRPPFAELVGWVSDSVERIGGQRTREAIEIYANGGYLAPEVRDILLQFISLSDEEDAPEKVEMKEVRDILLKLNKVLGHETVEVAPSPIEEETLG